MPNNTLAIIIARAGSKGLHSKCMLPIDGEPLINKTINLALDLAPSHKMDVVLSTDIPNAPEHDGLIILPRPKHLASDNARVRDVVFDVLQKMETPYQYVVLLYGNVPTRYEQLISFPLVFLQTSSYDAVISFQRVEKHHPDWMVDECETLPHDWQDSHRRQDLTPLITPDGHTFVFKTERFLRWMESGKESNTMYAAFGHKIKPWIHEELIIDIDSERDYLLAKSYLERGEG